MYSASSCTPRKFLTCIPVLLILAGEHPSTIPEIVCTTCSKSNALKVTENVYATEPFKAFI